jgi:hypothetical protein
MFTRFRVRAITVEINVTLVTLLKYLYYLYTTCSIIELSLELPLEMVERNLRKHQHGQCLQDLISAEQSNAEYT